ncbi:MAG: DUF29 domain-containing protein [Snowella sp.]|nr:MAG: DUF29 domain-containing protein [Snowella sp.]
MMLATSLSSLYEKDYVEWLDLTLAQLQNHDLEDLDWTHLIEEVEALGSEQRHKVESYLLKLLIHLLLYQYWETEKAWSDRGWKNEIDNFRLELDLLLESKVLYNYLLTVVDKNYQKARKNAIRKSQLSADLFPLNCPYRVEQILDPDWLP